MTSRSRVLKTNSTSREQTQSNCCVGEKGAKSIDGRTNSYRVTVEGFRLLDARRIHIEGAVDGGRDVGS